MQIAVAQKECSSELWHCHSRASREVYKFLLIIAYNDDENSVTTSELFRSILSWKGIARLKRPRDCGTWPPGKAHLGHCETVYTPSALSILQMTGELEF